MTAQPTATIEPTADPRDSWDQLTQAERDAAYNNNAAVPNAAALIAERNAASARFRAANPGALDVPYAAGERTRFDLYPAAPYGAPCLVFLHGGYWQRNGREMFAAMAEGAAAAGWSVAIPGYSLAPDATLTQIVGEIRTALDWLDAEGHSYGIQGPAVLCGWSAGAQLAAMALDHPRVVGALVISGVYDLGPIRDTYLDAALALTEAEVAAFSPLRLPATPKPMAIAYGEAELPALVHDSRRLHARRTEAGAPGPLMPVPGADHFTVLDALRQPGGLLLKAARQLVAGHAS